MPASPRPIGFGSPEPTKHPAKPVVPKNYVWHATSQSRIPVSYERALELHAIHERVSPNPMKRGHNARD